MVEENGIMLHEKVEKWNRTLLYLLPALNLQGNALSFEVLKRMGLTSGFIENKESNTDFKDCLWLIFQPSRSSEEKWHLFNGVFSQLDTFLVEEFYGNRIIAVCFRFKSEYFGIDEVFKTGKYSLIPQIFKGYEKHFIIGKNPLEQYYVLMSDENYRMGKEMEYLLPKNLLKGVELDEIPHIDKDIIFSLDNYRK